MTRKLILWGFTLSLMGLLPASGDLYLNADDSDDEVFPGLRLSVGYTYSDDLADLVDERHNYDSDCDDDGDWGWIDLSLGFEAPINLHIAAIPFISAYFNNADDHVVNSMLVPTFALKFLWETDGTLTDYWYPYAEYYPYLQLEASYTFPLEGGDTDPDDGGWGGAILVGYQIPYDFSVEVGVSYLPVEMDDERGHDDDCYNMGGFVARLVKTFW